MGRSLVEIQPATRWLGRPLEVHEVTDSTNRLCEDLARQGAPEGTLVIADRQTAGRGRLGRSFVSPPGCGLYLSVLLRPADPPERVHRLVFAAAVAVAEMARARLPNERRVEIKWPNDVLVDGRKTSGINLPVQLDGARVASAVLGIGVNVNTQLADLPPELHGIATSLAIAARSELDRVAVAEELLERLERQIDHLRAGEFERVLERWRSLFRMAGARISVGGPGVARQIEGTARGVDAEGALLVETSTGLERVLAGDVALLEKGT